MLSTSSPVSLNAFQMTKVEAGESLPGALG